MSTAPTPDDRLHAVLRLVVGRDALDALDRRAGGDSLWYAACRALDCDDRALSSRIARHFGIGVAVVGTLDPALRRLVPEYLARRLGVLPLRASETVLTLATATPGDADAERAIAAGSGRRVRLAVAPPSVVIAGIDALYRDAIRESGVDRAHPGVPEQAQRPAPAPTAREETRTTVMLVDEIVARGVRGGRATCTSNAATPASPCASGSTACCATAGPSHATPGRPSCRASRSWRGSTSPTACVRRTAARTSLSTAARSTSVSRRCRRRRARRSCSACSTRARRRSASTRWGSLQLTPRDCTPCSSAREGLILVTGPTGSGKTTTLYAALRHVQQRGVNVVTVEDPVEYRLPGIAQVQVNERTGLTFAAALRSILRQDPDVILVGEIRDRETASIAAQAALTGHLVLSTLHTVDAPSAVARLADLGVEPFKLAAALRGVVAQRLLRRLCDACQRAEPPSGQAACPRCDGSGYRGRVAAVELLACDAELARRITRGDGASSIGDAARASGMRSLWECALDHAARGVTDIEELHRCLDPPHARRDVPAPLPALDALFELT